MQAWLDMTGKGSRLGTCRDKGWKLKEKRKDIAFADGDRGENTYECGRVSPVGMGERSVFFVGECGSSTRSGGLFEK